MPGRYMAADPQPPFQTQAALRQVRSLAGLSYSRSPWLGFYGAPAAFTLHASYLAPSLPAQTSFFLSFWQGPVSSCFSALSLLETVLFHLPMASCFCLVVPSAGVYFLRSFLRVSAFLLGPPSASLKAHTYVGVVSLKFGEVLDYDVK